MQYRESSNRFVAAMTAALDREGGRTDAALAALLGRVGTGLDRWVGADAWAALVALAHGHPASEGPDPQIGSLLGIAETLAPWLGPELAFRLLEESLGTQDLSLPVTTDDRFHAGLIERMSAAIVVYDGRGVVRFGNDAAARIVGVVGPPALVGRFIGSLLPGPFLKQLRAVLLGGPPRERIRQSLARADGAVLEVEVAETAHLSGGRVCVQVTLSALASVEGELPLEPPAPRLDALARLAGGVAHQVNNVLGAIASQAVALELQQPAGSAMAVGLAGILEATRRGAAVTANLLGFAEGGMYRRDSLAVGILVLEGALAARRRSNGRADVKFDMLTEGLWVEGDASQIRAAIDAVCDNALEASAVDGVVALRAYRAEITASDGYYLSPGRYAVIEVRDSGPGLSEEVLARAYEPYYTTRAEDGRGLGLAMVYGVLHHHDGLVRLENHPQGGACASLYLPEAQAPRKAAPPISLAPAAVRAGGNAVLVVDDDELMRDGARRLLERLGYWVVEARDGAEGVAAYLARTAPFEFLLLDLRMPVLGGPEALRQILAHDPDARVILCTGFDRDQVVGDLFTLGRVGFLPKPFTLAQLVEQVRFVRPDARIKLRV